MSWEDFYYYSVDYFLIIFPYIFPIIVILLIALLSIIFFPRPFVRMRISSRAKRDYEEATGSQQKKALIVALRRIKSRYGNICGKQKELGDNLRMIEADEHQELISALTAHIVSTRIHEIESLSPDLQGDLVAIRFDGRIRSLLSSTKVPGIGEKRATFIETWVRRVESELLSCRKKEFPGKAEILSRNREKKESLRKKRTALDPDVRSLSEIMSAVSEAIGILSKTDVNHFRKVYLGDEKVAEQVNQYILGVFPPWEEPPEWYIKALECS